MTARDRQPVVFQDPRQTKGAPQPNENAGHAIAVSRTIWARGVKRTGDFVLATAGLVIVSPVLLGTMLLVKLTSPGPIFFRQVRTGRDGCEFRPFKLRTMRSGRVPQPGEIVPLDHPEVTGVGRLLRRLKLDELPQILNVVCGDMALVGPRPTLPEQTRQYDEFERQRLGVRPGLTGLAQVNGNTALSWPERIEYDVYYVRHHGFWMDLGILLKTLLVIVGGEARFARKFAQSPYARRAPWIHEPAHAARYARGGTEPSPEQGPPGGAPQ